MFNKGPLFRDAGGVNESNGISVSEGSCEGSIEGSLYWARLGGETKRRGGRKSTYVWIDMSEVKCGLRKREGYPY